MGRQLGTLLLLGIACCLTCRGFRSDAGGEFSDEEDFFSDYEGSGGGLDFFFSSMLEFNEDSGKEYPPLYKCVRCTSVRIGGCDVENLRQRADVIQECPGQCLNISSGNYFAYDCAESLAAATGCTENAGMTMCLCAGDACNAPPGLLPLPPGSGAVGDNHTSAGNHTTETGVNAGKGDGAKTDSGGVTREKGEGRQKEGEQKEGGQKEGVRKEGGQVEGGHGEGAGARGLATNVSAELILQDDLGDADEGHRRSGGGEASVDLQLARGQPVSPPVPLSTVLARALNSRSGAGLTHDCSRHVALLLVLCLHAAIS